MNGQRGESRGMKYDVTLKEMFGQLPKRLLEIAGDCWRLLEIAGDCWR
jgi:hypothetical protein